MDFFESLPATFVGAFLGTFAAFLSERLLRRKDAAYVEVAALNNLITDLYLRRALTPINPVTSHGGPSDDRNSATAAIMQIRDSIRQTRLALRPKSTQTFQALVGMSSACNGYLENVQNRPGDYQHELHVLRLNFMDTIGVLGTANGVVVREPGAGAFQPSSSV